MTVEYPSVVLPTHIAFIPDGNRRWAKDHNLSTVEGHEAGFRRLNDIIKECVDLGIKYFTVYVFSTENWNRPAIEVDRLLNLLERLIDEYANECALNGIKISIFGDMTRFNERFQKMVASVQRRTMYNKKMNLALCLNYGARKEIVMACKSIVTDIFSKKIKYEEVDEKLFEKYLYTKGLSDPDLIIRTSGEVRVSNFLLWQMAYSEFVFEQKFLPDYTVDDFYHSLEIYRSRCRRMGT